MELTVIDSHTAGEPTRVLVAGGPDLGGGSIDERMQRFRQDHDRYRVALVTEPRGNDVMVGAVLCEPAQADNAAATFFFNNVSYLRMCGHGTIGLAVTLAHLGRIGSGSHRLETPAGVVSVQLHDANRVSVENVPCYRLHKDYRLRVPAIGEVKGDIAWGGNWFFLIEQHGQQLEYGNTERLTDYCRQVRNALDDQGVRGPDGELIDHIELVTALPGSADADSRNFVLCPGLAYDRSPCGTGTSAKVACLVSDGKLEPGDTWRQQSITGSVFECRAKRVGNTIVPTLTGSAYITAQSTMRFDPRDPFCFGIQTPA